MRTKHHLHCVKGLVKDDKEWMSCDIYILIFPLPAVSPALPSSVCLPVNLLHTLMNEVNEVMTHRHTTHTHTKTHRYRRTHKAAEQHVVWCGQLTFHCKQSASQSWMHSREPTPLHTQTCKSCQWMRDFFSAVYLIKHTCALDSHYITLHSQLWLSAI